MAVVEGYTFAVDMQDRGVRTTLRQMKADASAMKAAMRSGFETIQQGEGTLSAYNFKLQESERQIQNYKRMQKELREELEKLDKARQAEIKDTGSVNDKTEKQYAKVARQIENYQHQVNRLSKAQKEAKTTLAQYNIGLAKSRQETQSIKAVMSSYVNELKSEGRAFASSKAEASSLRLQHAALAKQYKAETAETTRLNGQLNRLKKQYDFASAAVQRMKKANQQETAEYQKLSGRMNAAREGITHVNEAMSKQVVAALKVRTSINQISRAEASVNAGGITRLSRAMNNLSENARRASSNTRAWAQSVRGGFMTAAFAVAPFGAAIGKSVQMSASLQTQWNTTKNLLVTGGEQVKSVTKTIGQMQHDASKYSKEYGYSQKEIANQYTELVKRGYTSKAALGSMKSMLEAARASGDDFNDVIRSSSQVLDAFGLQSNNAATQAAHTKEVVNTMAYSADMTSTSFKDLGLAMSYVSASASQAGFSVEETSAAIGILSNSGVEGSKAGTGLRKVINSIISPTKGAKEALDKVNLSLDDFKTKSGQLKSMPAIFKMLDEHTKNLGKADKGAFFKALFGTTGQQAGTILAQSMDQMAKGNKNLEALTENIQKAEKGNGYVHKLATKNMQTTQMRLKQLQMDIQDIAINLGKKLLPVVDDVARAFSDWLGSKTGQKSLDDFSNSIQGLGDIVGRHSKEIISFFGGFVDGLSGVARVAGGVIKLVDGVTGAIAKFLHLNGAGNNIAKWAGEATGAVVGMIGAFKLLKTVVGGMSAVRQDIRNMFHLDGVASEQTKIDEENQKLKENIALWKEHNTVSGGDSAIGGEIGALTKEKPQTSAKSSETLPAVAKETTPSATRMERLGQRSAQGYGRGFIRYLKPVMKGAANIAVMTFTGGILDADMIGGIVKKLFSGIKGAGNKVKGLFSTIFSGASKEASQSGAKAGATFAGSLTRSARKGHRFSLSSLFRGSSKEAGKHGAKAGSSFSENATRMARQSNKGRGLGNLFSGAAKEAGKHGSKAGTSFAENASRMASHSKGILEAGKSLGSRMGGAATIAFGAIDLFKAATTSSKKNRAQAVGKSLGSTAGAAGGMAIGASLGSVVPGVGTVIGGILGSMIGEKAGGKIGEAFGKLWPKIKKGAAVAASGIGKLISAPFKWAYKEGQKLGNFIKRLGKGSKGRKDNTFGSGNYSAKDRKLVQQMTSAVRSYTKALQALKKTKMTNYFSQMSKQIRKSKINKELSQMDKTTRRSARNWRSLVKPLKQVSNSFRLLQKSMRTLTNKKNGFTALNNSARTLYRTLRKNPFGKFIASQAKIANNAMGGKKSGFVTNFNRQTRSMEHELRRFSSTFKHDWRNTWSGIGRPVSHGMSAAHSALNSHLDKMQSKAKSFEDVFLKGWKSWINQVVSAFRSGFNKLPGYASSAMREIINRLNRGIQGVNGVIDNFGGDKHLATISYAQGTKGGGHPGGHMLVNDSNRPHWKELVKLPNRPWTIFKERNVLIPNAPAGTKVINGEKTHEIMNRMGVHRYAGGTMSEAEQDEMAMEFMDHPNAASKKLLLRMTNWNSRVPVVADLGKAMTIAFSQSIANVLKDLLGIIKEPINGDWTPVIKSAFRVLHLHAQGWQISKLLRQIQTESGGSESVVNHWDSNARAGHPSQGLLQFIPSTFYSWADPRYRNINKGFDQLVAAIRCLNAGGEGGWGNIGNGHGWATGGIVGTHGLYEMAEGNLPESIIPLDLNKRPRALQVMNNTLDHMENDGGGTGNIRRGDSKEDLQFKRQVIGLLGSIAGLSKQQINAILSLDLDKNSMNRRSNRANFYNKYGRDQHLADFQRLV